MAAYMDGWHFTDDSLRDGRSLPKQGVWLSLPKELKPSVCVFGFHMCKEPLNALSCAPGWNVAKVRITGRIDKRITTIDQACGLRRKALTPYVDATFAVEKFARDCAITVAEDIHAPEFILDILYRPMRTHYQPMEPLTTEQICELHKYIKMASHMEEMAFRYVSYLAYSTLNWAPLQKYVVSELVLREHNILLNRGIKSGEIADNYCNCRHYNDSKQCKIWHKQNERLKLMLEQLFQSSEGAS